MASPTEILKSPDYVNANLETKQAIFDKHIASSPDYANANPETQQAIKERFGLSGGVSAEGTPLNVPTPQGPFIGSDRPAPIQKQPQAKSWVDYVAPAVEVPLTLASGLGGQVAGNIYGAYKALTSPNVGTQQAVKEGEQASQNVQNALTYKPSSPVTQDILGAVGGALESSKLNVPYVPESATLGRALRQANTFSSLPSYAAAQAEKVSPVISNIENKVANVLKKEPKPFTPSLQQLEEQSSNLFNKAKKSGVELNVEDFSNQMNDITAGLREYGYDPRLHPKLSIAIENLTNPDIPKDFKELKTLRTFIQNAQKSADPTEKMLASKLKTDFDSYIATMPEESVIGGSKEGLKAWKEARDTYSKLSKSEIFEDMLNKADLNATKYSQSGVENYLANKLRNLANNDKQMRLFTPAEQDAIREAAQGGNIQNILRMAGKYSPTSVIATAGGSYLGASLLGPAGAVIAPAVGAGAKYAATQMRKSDVNKLAELMRQGGNPEVPVNWQRQVPINERLVNMLKLNQGE